MSSERKDEGHMLRTQIAAAIGCARGNALDEIMREVWTRYSAGQLTEDEAGQLSTLAHERRAAWRGSGQAALGLVMPPPGRAARRRFAGTAISRADRRAGYGGRPTGRRCRRSCLPPNATSWPSAEKGERTGPLGSVAIEVLEFFVNLVDFRTGRLEPSLTTIMGKVRRSRDAVVRALKALRAHGFLDWLRRYEPTGRTKDRPPGAAGEQCLSPVAAGKGAAASRPVRQGPSPARRIMLPPRKPARPSWTPTGRPCPSMSGAVRGGQQPARTGARRAWKRAMQERESAKQTESPSDLYLSMKT
jgi:hypothetical protein